jgi:uncharacterized protein (TIGR03083 family)
MTATATKVDVERELMRAWEALASAVDSFSDATMEQPGVLEGWSMKDLLGHIAFWSQRAAEYVPLVAAGKADEVRFPADVAAVDEWNERERRLRQDRSLSDVREEWLESFQAAMQALADFPSDKLEEKIKGQTVLRWFAMDTYEHYREHLAQLSTWRQNLKTTEE